MATSLEESEKRGPDQSSINKYLSFGEKIVKIGQVDPEIIGIRAIVKKIKKLIQAKCIALQGGLLSGLNKGKWNIGNVIYEVTQSKPHLEDDLTRCIAVTIQEN